MRKFGEKANTNVEELSRADGDARTGAPGARVDPNYSGATDSAGASEEKSMRAEARAGEPDQVATPEPDSSGDSSDRNSAAAPSGNREVAQKRQDESRLLVPSSMEVGIGSVDRYVISKQIVRMQEPRRLTPEDLDERRIIYPDSPDRKTVNRFRDLRTRLLEISGGNNFTLVVTGAASGAGTSFMALNLAVAFAFDQAKTALLIDCNLREPTLHSSLDILPESGLTDFLDDPDYDIARVIYPTGIPRLRLIPAGTRRESPSEFFTSFRMKQFLQAVRRRYPDRYIILDTGSVNETPDARILTELCDYSLLVVPHGRVTSAQVDDACRALHSEKFVGAVLND